MAVLQWLATTSPDPTLTIHRHNCHFDMFNYLQNGNAILKPNRAIGPVIGPKYHFKFSSFKCFAGKWLDSSNVLTVQGNWGSLERQAASGEIFIVLMIDKDWCSWLNWWSAIMKSFIIYVKKSRVTIEVDERYSSIPAPAWARRSDKSEHMVGWWSVVWSSIMAAIIDHSICWQFYVVIVLLLMFVRV